MPDREKVINGLEQMLADYAEMEKISVNRKCHTLLYHKAMTEDALALLKEQEPVWNDVLHIWTCPSCGQMVSTNYCRDCGKRMKWE